MLNKKKMCAGWDGNSHEDYIYKNIEGKKYCKSCTLKLQKPKSIPKRSEKQVFKMSLKAKIHEEDKKFYLKIWDNRTWRDDAPGFLPDVPPKCEVCSCHLGYEPNLMYFHHILEKRNYPELRYVPENIAIVCADCHNRYETFPDSVPKLQERREKLLISEGIRKILRRE